LPELDRSDCCVPGLLASVLCGASRWGRNPVLGVVLYFVGGRHVF